VNSVAVEDVRPSEIDALAPLSHALHRHHQAAAPALGPFVRQDTSWTAARALLAAAAGDGLLLRIGPAAAPLAMACVTISYDDPLWIGAIEPNAEAIRLYERRGFRPAWLQLTRFEQRGMP
jgi:hypothetical protein